MPKRPRDANQLAKMIVDISTGDMPDAVQPESSRITNSRRGGLKGGESRAKALSPERRREIAKAAAQKRWQKD